MLANLQKESTDIGVMHIKKIKRKSIYFKTLSEQKKVRPSILQDPKARRNTEITKKQKNCSATDVNMNLHNILGFSDQNIIPRSNIASKFIHNCKNYVKLFQLYSNLLPYSDSQINQPAIHNFFKLKIIAKKVFSYLSI